VEIDLVLKTQSAQGREFSRFYVWMRSVNTRVSLAKPPNVFEQIVLGIRRRQFGFDPFQGGMKTVEPFAELSRCERDPVASTELKVINRFIEVTTQSILRVWLEGALAILADQFLDFVGAEEPARRLSARTSGFRGCAAFRSHDWPIAPENPRAPSARG